MSQSNGVTTPITIQNRYHTLSNMRDGGRDMERVSANVGSGGIVSRMKNDETTV
jgi:hypothetical protein